MQQLNISGASSHTLSPRWTADYLWVQVHDLTPKFLGIEARKLTNLP